MSRHLASILFALTLLVSPGCSAAQDHNEATQTTAEAAPASTQPPMGSLTVKIKERAIEKKGLHDVTVMVGQRSLSPDATRAFQAEGLPVGEIKVVVEAKNHVATATTVAVHEGLNETAVGLPLSVQETYRRYYKAYTFSRLKTAYKYLHPDVVKHYSYKTFKREMSGDQSVSLKLGDTRIRRTWKSKTTKRTYHNVTEIDRTYISEVFGRRFTDNRSQHWALRDGLWLLIFP